MSTFRNCDDGGLSRLVTSNYHHISDRKVEEYTPIRLVPDGEFCLPKEIVEHVFHFLSSADRASLGQCCKYLHEIEIGWGAWRDRRNVVLTFDALQRAFDGCLGFR